MTFARVFDLYIDTAAAGGPNPLLQATNGSPLTIPVSWVQADCFTLRLHFRSLNGFGVTTTAVALAAGDEIVLAAKAAVADSTLLFNAMGFTEVTGGGDTYYQATLDLNTTELDTALTGSTLTALVDVEVQNADNTARLTFRFSVTIVAQAYDDEADPTPGTPTYPAPSAVMVKNPSGGSYRYHEGNFQIYNATTTKWYTLFVTGTAGAEQLTIGEGET